MTDSQNELLYLVGQIENGVDQGRIPSDEATSTLGGLNRKYPILGSSP